MGLPGSPAGLTSVSVCGFDDNDRRANACSLSKCQAAVLLLREHRGLIVDVLHIHDHLGAAGGEGQGGGGREAQSWAPWA